MTTKQKKNKTKPKAKKPTKKQVAPKQKALTHVVIILDKSGSMADTRQEAVDAFNNIVKTVKKEAGNQDARLSLITFSTTRDAPVFFDAPIDQLKELTLADYQPDGWTALLDAVGKTLDELKVLPYANEARASFLVSIITDGHENRSILETWQTVSQRIKDLTATGRWTFTYLGANQDLLSVARASGIPVSNTLNYTSSKIGTSHMSGVHGSSTASYLRSRAYADGSVACSATSDFFPEERDADVLAAKLEAEKKAAEEAAKQQNTTPNP